MSKRKAGQPALEVKLYHLTPDKGASCNCSLKHPKGHLGWAWPVMHEATGSKELKGTRRNRWHYADAANEGAAQLEFAQWKVGFDRVRQTPETLTIAGLLERVWLTRWQHNPRSKNRNAIRARIDQLLPAIGDLPVRLGSTTALSEWRKCLERGDATWVYKGQERPTRVLPRGTSVKPKVYSFSRYITMLLAAFAWGVSMEAMIEDDGAPDGVRTLIDKAPLLKPPARAGKRESGLTPQMIYSLLAYYAKKAAGYGNRFTPEHRYLFLLAISGSRRSAALSRLWSKHVTFAFDGDGRPIKVTVDFRDWFSADPTVLKKGDMVESTTPLVVLFFYRAYTQRINDCVLDACGRNPNFPDMPRTLRFYTGPDRRHPGRTRKLSVDNMPICMQKEIWEDLKIHWHSHLVKHNFVTAAKGAGFDFDDIGVATGNSGSVLQRNYFDETGKSKIRQAVSHAVVGDMPSSALWGDANVGVIVVTGKKE